jgi:glycosyltransferase involved in cell wall biosynthesis
VCRLRVGCISRWGVRCGVSTYTDQLVEAVVRQGTDVFCVAETVGGLAAVPVTSKIDVVRCWDGKNMNVDNMFLRLKMGKADVVHFQHEFGIMNQARPLAQLIAVLGRAGIPSVFTCHTVMPKPNNQTGWFFGEILRQIDAVVVHAEGARQAIIDWGYRADKVQVIPHGTMEGCQVVERQAARETLGLPTDPGFVIAVSVGFITPGKKQRETIEKVISLVSDGRLDPQKFLFIIAGEPGQGDLTNIRYNREINELVENSRAGGYIKVISEFVPVDQLPLWYGAADFAITASHQTYHSISGRSHQEMAFGVPSVSSRALLLSDLDETRSLKADLDQDGGTEFGDAIVRLATDPELRQKLSEACLRFAAETSWTNVARQHVELYQKLTRKS